MIIYALTAIGSVAGGTVICQLLVYFITGEADLSMGFAGVVLALCLGFIGVICEIEKLNSKKRKKKSQ